ncbi:acyl dehydratase [Natronococcus occultus SP4]|uniref:Acyl dehydratase n=1 Tax=Natronococcus occultus SP4 TaxID=694430 RepID=L0K156_9EURY|nr:MaoC family dehydratase [Natronococcus occultus]AGB38731.1 acyl dehydratase [Natronococcus occultus SP4]
MSRSLTAETAGITPESPTEDWRVDRSVERYDDLGVGDVVRFTKPITDEDVASFAGASGDLNPLHLETGYATETMFDGRIAHGGLVAGTISAALARFPGVVIYLSQDLEFHAPIEIGGTVTATCEIVEALGENRYRLETTVTDEDGSTAIAGEAVVTVNSPPAAE